MKKLTAFALLAAVWVPTTSYAQCGPVCPTAAPCPVAAPCPAPCPTACAPICTQPVCRTCICCPKITGFLGC
jgi:hypothetical protein